MVSCGSTNTEPGAVATGSTTHTGSPASFLRPLGVWRRVHHPVRFYIWRLTEGRRATAVASGKD